MKYLKLWGAAAALLWIAVGAHADTSDLSGDWKVMLENSLSRKRITFRIEEKDHRLRGKVFSREYGTQDLDGRREEDGKVFFWWTVSDRAGHRTDSSFRGKLEGEAMVGKGRFFDKSYDFRAERVGDAE